MEYAFHRIRVVNLQCNACVMRHGATSAENELSHNNLFSNVCQKFDQFKDIFLKHDERPLFVSLNFMTP